ncbi:IS66 family insertion sequence element accessory protein TnpB, partial [Segatella copri]|uniref:IS66 family insertion sequence element accessory protein TnpB n=1 Tax=Segatella copri TaxID=165179 RepID=UPI002FF029A7
MLNFTSRTNFYICSIPTDMRKGREGLATIVREYFHRDPTAYGEAFIFYNKKYDTVKILHYDLNGYVIYQKWFDDGKMLKPKFMEIKSCPSNPQPIGFSGILLAKRQKSFYCTYFLHNRNVADTKSPYPIKRLEVIRWFNQKSMV